MTHNSTSGVAHFAAENDEDCLQQIRYLLSFLPSNNVEGAPIVETGDDPMRTDDSLNTLLPDNSNQAYDMYDVIKSIVDNGEFYENQKYWATNIITCFARMDGQTVGIIANQPKVMAGCLDINASDKSRSFHPLLRRFRHSSAEPGWRSWLPAWLQPRIRRHYPSRR